MKYTREQCRAIELAFLPSLAIMTILEVLFGW